MSVELNRGDLILDRYQITGLLGQGGVGVVYEAHDTRLNRPVAVKVLRKRALGTRTAAQRMLREARTLASVSHPNLVVLLDYELLPEGVPALVMERVGGMSAQAWLKKQHFTVYEAISVVHQCLGALAVCHDAGIIHRDLKPSNILIERRPDGRLFAKVIDFGIVRFNADEMATALTLAGEIFGSPRYMAPEQWTQKPVDARTDVYAMGLIAHVFLSGDHFINVTNPIEVFEAHMRPERPLLEVAANGERVPPIVATAIQRAMHPEPEHRFEDCDAFLKALDPLLTPSGSYAMPSSSYFEAAQALAAAEEAELEEIPADDATAVDLGGAIAARLMQYETSQQQPPKKQSGSYPAAPKGVGDRRLSFDNEHTAITSGDFLRALAQAPTADPDPISAPPVTAPPASVPPLDVAPSVIVRSATEQPVLNTQPSPAVPEHVSAPAELVPGLWKNLLGRLFFWKRDNKSK